MLWHKIRPHFKFVKRALKKKQNRTTLTLRNELLVAMLLLLQVGLEVEDSATFIALLSFGMTNIYLAFCC